MLPPELEARFTGLEAQVAMLTGRLCAVEPITSQYQILIDHFGDNISELVDATKEIAQVLGGKSAHDPAIDRIVAAVNEFIPDEDSRIVLTRS